jgi:hypothetical protein
MLRTQTEYRRPTLGAFGLKVHRSKATKRQMCKDGIKFFIDLQ